MKTKGLISGMLVLLCTTSCGSDGRKIVSHLNKNGEGEYHLVTTGLTTNGTTSLGYYPQDESAFCVSYRDYDSRYILEIVTIFTIGQSDAVAGAYFGRTVDSGVTYSVQNIANYDVHTRNHRFSSFSLYEVELNQLSATAERYANNDIERGVELSVHSASRYLKKRGVFLIFSRDR